MKTSMKCFAAIAFLLASTLAAAQPVKPVRMMVGFPPGGAVDILARIFAERLAEGLGHPVIVETRPGAAGQLAAEVVKTAPPDGYTIMLCPDASVVVRPLTLRKAPYDPIADFAAVAHTGLATQALAVSAAVPAKDLREFTAWAKANPDKASVALPGLGGSVHFFAVMIAQELGVNMQMVPYKGSGPSVSDLAAGHVMISVNPLGTMLAQYKAGKIRVIAVSAKQRTVTAPDVPTFTEQGYPQLNMDAWFGIFAPVGTPAELVNRMNAIVIQAERTPVIRDRMHGLDLDIQEMTPAEFAALVKRDYERWTPVVKASGFKADEQ